MAVPLKKGIEAGAVVVPYLSRLPFNGILYVSKLEDAIQEVDGVRDIQLSHVRLKMAQQYAVSTTFNSSYNVNRKTTSYAGYIKCVDCLLTYTTA